MSTTHRLTPKSDVGVPRMPPRTDPETNTERPESNIERPESNTEKSAEAIKAPSTTRFADRTLAVLRLATGFVFLWAFLDKLFGLGYSTAGAKSWINGGSPTNGFLSHLDSGPLRTVFGSIAGTAWVDWIFMIGLLGIGVAVMLGVALRVSAIAGSIMMLAMWLAEWPLATTGVSGAATGSTNPLVDYHIIYALALIVVAALAAGKTWGLGKVWARTPLVRRNGWLR